MLTLRRHKLKKKICMASRSQMALLYLELHFYLFVKFLILSKIYISAIIQFFYQMKSDLKGYIRALLWRG